jgi:hypothetical protein
VAPGELEETFYAQQPIERLVANAGEENTTKVTESRGPPLGDFMISATGEAQHRAKHEQSSIPYARIILQDPPEGGTGIALKDHRSLQPIFKRTLEKRTGGHLP